MQIFIMKKSEIFQIILDVVCGCLEIDTSDVFSARKSEDIVTARCLIATSCRDYNMRNKHIQQFLQFKSHNSVRGLLAMYDSRKAFDRSFRFYANTVAHELDKILPANCQ